jgi:hypothetical protein
MPNAFLALCFNDLGDPGEVSSRLARIFHELLSRNREDGRATGQPSRGTAGLVPRRT